MINQPPLLNGFQTPVQLRGLASTPTLAPNGAPLSGGAQQASGSSIRPPQLGLPNFRFQPQVNFAPIMPQQKRNPHGNRSTPAATAAATAQVMNANNGDRQKAAAGDQQQPPQKQFGMLGMPKLEVKPFKTLLPPPSTGLLSNAKNPNFPPAGEFSCTTVVRSAMQPSTRSVHASSRRRNF